MGETLMKHVRDATTFLKVLRARNNRMYDKSAFLATLFTKHFHWSGYTHPGTDRKVGTPLHAGRGPMARLPMVHTIQGA